MVFKVTLKDVFKRAEGKPHRLIAIKSDDTLYDLAEAIVKSFDFYFDHAFGFYDNLRNPFRSKVQYELFADEEDEEIGMGEAEKAYRQALEEARDEIIEQMYRVTLQAMKDTLLPRIPPHLHKEVERMIEEEVEDIKARTQADRELLKMFGLDSGGPLPFLQDEEPRPRSVKNTRISEAFTKLKQKMLFVFDYGDDWRFEVQLVRTEPRQKGVRYPKVLERVGESPKQYPDYEDEDEDEF
ncbi:hypothetical protein Mtai_v1c08750 [Meiothermus taiwanensis WR-220]|nr:hypothetical protein Mtai_v1c08750 [Meiothermus taiwanensis WR-220]